MELAVVNINGQDTGRKVNLDDALFAIEPNDHAIYLDVKYIQANKRQGTHDSRERSDVAGSTKKLKKQKGTGTARFGDIKNPIFRGGGRVFGPHPRDYRSKVNKKLKRLARQSALSYKVTGNQVVVVEDFKFETFKTKQFRQILTDLNQSTQKILLVVNEMDRNLYFAARNIQGAKVQRAENLNTYDILDAKTVIFMESAVKSTEELLSKK